MPDAVLAARALSCEAAGRWLLRDLTVVAQHGDLIEIRGANGSGKSTLLRCLAGLAAPARGRVERSAPLHYLGHRSGISGQLTPVENLRWLARLRRLRVSDDALEQAMDRVGLGAERHDLVATLSAGQQRRAALARLLVGDVPLWLLDEPLAALDEAGAKLVRELIASHRASGGAAICATHAALEDGASSATARTVQLG